MSIQLVKAIVGMGNPNQAHVARTNRFDPDTEAFNKLTLESFNGGYTPQSLNDLAVKSSGLTAQNQGTIEVEDGWNTQRGLCMLRFVVSENALQSEELTVLGYLTGGDYSSEGISGDVLFVPTRSWSVVISQKQDLTTGLPEVFRNINNSQQFLTNNTNLVNNDSLNTLRPSDVVLELGARNIHDGGNYGGASSADLNAQGVIPSKSNNLDPTHVARQILTATVNPVADSKYNGHTDVSDGIFANMDNLGLNEIQIEHNAFFNSMMAGTGQHTMMGFVGFTFEEIISVFQNLSEVLDLNMIQPNMFETMNWLEQANEYGGASYEEVLAQEIAMMTVHTLVKSGLTFYEFSASNDFNETGVSMDEGGILFVDGAAMPILENEQNLPGRVNTFKEEFAKVFFSRYTNRGLNNSFTIGVNVSCYLFGETKVTIVVNGDTSREATYANATYLINRTSSNVTQTNTALGLTANVYDNLIKGL